MSRRSWTAAEIWARLHERALFLLVAIFRRLGMTFGQQVVVGHNVRLQSIRNLAADPDGRLEIGDHCIIYENARLRAVSTGRIVVGQQCIFGDTKIFSRSLIEIGDQVLTSWNVLIQDYDPHPAESELRSAQMTDMTFRFRPRSGSLSDADKKKLKEAQTKLAKWLPPTGPIRVGDNTWVGANVCIFKGAQIGKNCVIAANSVVTAGVYPDRSLLAGQPAKVIKFLES